MTSLLNSEESVDYGYDSAEDEVANASVCSHTNSVETRGGVQGDDASPGQDIALGETLVITRLRGAVFTLLAVASVVVSLLVYSSSSHAESCAFDKAFADASDKVVESLKESVQHKVGAVDGLALDLSSFARGTNATWPMVTLPDFDMRGASTRSLADALVIMLLPVVTQETQKAWQDYAVSHQDWIPDLTTLTTLTAEAEQVMHEPPEQTASASTSASASALVARSRQLQRQVAGIPREIFNENGTVSGPGPFLPLWQTSPVLPGCVWMFNMDMLSITAFTGGLSAVLKSKDAVLGQVSNLKLKGDSGQSSPALDSLLHQSTDTDTSTDTSSTDTSTDTSGRPKTVPHVDPVSPLFYPVLDHYGADSNVVAVLSTMLSWRTYLTDILSPGVTGIVCVVQNQCGQAFTYQINGHDAVYLGEGDLHDTKFNDYIKSVDLGKKTKSMPLSTVDETNDEQDVHYFGAAKLNDDYCSYSLSVFPSKVMYQEFITAQPVFDTLQVALLFLIASLLFYVYDWLVERRQKVVLEHAQESTAIVSSLFPDIVRDRLFRRGSDDAGADVVDQHQNVSPTQSGVARSNSDLSRPGLVEPTKNRLKTFLSDEGAAKHGSEADKPLADLFPNCTVLFADIAGFTAWSSLRDPSQVFTLLESVYQSFDKIARKRGVFKVETIGDSYVAVTGLPDPQEDHAVIMARFARDCKTKFKDVTRKLELTLGPDTGDLLMRLGLHSGPVTAGVLRGEKSRFQLFGDTVNTAARMESTGEKDRIQVSQSTANLLIAAGRGRWVRPRDKMVEAKGKGSLQTYWVELSSRSSVSGSDSRSLCSEDSGIPMDPNESKADLWGKESEIPEIQTQRSKHQRLVDYNVDLLCQHLRQIVARRMVIAAAGRRDSEGNGPPNLSTHRDSNESTMVLEEVTEIIKLPNFDPRAFKDHVDPNTVVLDPKVVSQLKRYVTIIAAMYRNNPFHNFEHASHVAMSMNKLLQRVVAPDITMEGMSDKCARKVVSTAVTRRNSLTSISDAAVGSALHNYTFGITSDPLTQFALVFSALIHDCDHWGVSNAQLIKEGVPIAAKYANKSVAEQNSVDLAWDLLLESEEYGDLQRCIFPTDDEYKRFRQVVVNIVMSTDIFDKHLGQLRKNRWAKAFDNSKNGEIEPEDEKDLKATIVIEHIMQASDVAHTMQHWHVYQKWNRRLFDELYTAHRAGRMEVDPAGFWYKGELGFFDNYIIPLAQKLKDCGVFGVSSEECLNYAMDNRREWESKGEMIVRELVSNFERRDAEDEQAPASKKKRLRAARRRSLITTGG